ncbi:ROK family protein [Pedobacter polaris]|uniref:ROK family protein n=1 Tax=Pedobacter polaris TaxID=2571273 RepID=A0A4V5NZB8_9SPHI|nr:ROK family protein [Pedobacter polaris]TKC07905.1 ROK family protein [Pedobacter polaris]
MKSLIISKDHISKLSNIDKKKHIQKLRLLKTIIASGPKSVSDLSAILFTSTPTSIQIINELLHDGIIEKNGYGKSIGGRKPELYMMKPNSLYILSIEMEGFKTKMAIVDNNNNIVSGIQSFPLVLADEVNAVDLLYNYARQLIKSSEIDFNKLIGIGISIPGLVNTKYGSSYTYIISNRHLQTLQQVFEEKFNRPVFIQNDVKSSALAESKVGLAQDKRDVLVLLMDWGIGLGIIMDGELRSGTSGFAGEIGHIPFVEDGALCYCGKRGCLETVASGIALVRMAKEGIKSGQLSMLNELSDQEIDKIEPHIVIDAANRGDQYAINILSDIGKNLGKAIATLIQLFNPELVILGGRIAEAKQYITTPIQHSINMYSMVQFTENTKIVLSELGPDAGILGNVHTVVEKIFDYQIELIGA